MLFLCISYAKSDDAKWELILKRLNTFVMKVDVLDSLDAMALLDFKGFCEVYNSTDGGESWNEVYSEDWNHGDPLENYPRPQHAYNLSYPSKNYVYIQFDTGQIRRSRDNGKTYDTIIVAPIPNPKNVDIGGFEMFDSLVGACSLLKYMPEGSPYAFTEVILFTEDGWDTWQTIELDNIFYVPISINNFWFFSLEHWGFISNRADDASKFYYTYDKGKTWDYYKLWDLIDTKECFLSNVFFVDEKLGWIVGGKKNYKGDQRVDAIFKTTDSGHTWELNYLQENFPVFGLNDIAFKDDMNGIAVGAWGKILRTTNGGETWVQEYGENHETDMEGNPVMQVNYFGTKPIISTRGGGFLFWKEKTSASVISIDDQFNKVYPNPAKINVYIDFMVELENLPNISVELYNLTGILQAKLDYNVDYNYSNEQGTLNCNIENIPNGYYIIVIDNGKRKIAKPFIVNKD